MKIGRKICCLILVALTVVSSYGESFAVDDNREDIKDFTTKRITVVTYNAYNTGYVSSNNIVGICTTYLGSWRYEKKVDNKNYDAIVVECCMEPRETKNKYGTKVYGVSQYLKLESTLASHCTYRKNSPVNGTIGEDEYSYGLSVSTSDVGFSGSVNVYKAHCIVTDYSKPTDNLFKIVYDYKTGKRSDDRCETLYLTTWQDASCEWTTNLNKYNVVLDVQARFGITKSKDGYDMGSNYISNHTGLWIASFTKDMK